jgi:serpin B
MWPADDFQSHAAYRKVIADIFNGGVTHLPYRKDPEASRRQINDHIDRATNRRIRELLAEGDVRQNTRFFLTNAIVFDANWKSEFDKGLTAPGDFYLSPHRKVSVPTMYHDNLTVNYAKTDRFEFIEIALRQANFGFVVILPESMARLSSVEERVTDAVFRRGISELKQCKTPLSMPKFSIRWKDNLVATFKEMGVREAFEEHADFSRMSRQSSPIYLIQHEAMIAVDEAGAKAAAATAVAGFVSGPWESISIDRPFLAVLYHRPTRTVLFIARISDPRE